MDDALAQRCPACGMTISDDVPIRDHFEAILDEQRRGLVVAEQEREKAAQALIVSLTSQINQGDNALREHIEQQVQQIKAALAAAERLADQRDSTLEHMIDAVATRASEQLAAVRREILQAAESSEKAVTKAEVATEKRFESVNEWRAQSLDRERSQQEQTTILTGTFMPREVAEAQIGEIRRTVADLAEKISKVV